MIIRVLLQEHSQQEGVTILGWWQQTRKDLDLLIPFLLLLCHQMEGIIIYYNNNYYYFLVLLFLIKSLYLGLLLCLQIRD